MAARSSGALPVAAASSISRRKCIGAQDLMQHRMAAIRWGCSSARLTHSPSRRPRLPSIAKLLWPKSVAIIGASSDTRGLRGRIVQIMRSHAYAGAVYPVSRSETEVQGLKAYKSVAGLPPTDLAAMIIPAKFVPQELENCGKAGIQAAIILSSASPRRKARD